MPSAGSVGANQHSDLEPTGPSGFSLHEHRARQNLIAVDYVACAQVDEIAPAQLAVDRMNSGGSRIARVLKVNPDCQTSRPVPVAAFNCAVSATR